MRTLILAAAVGAAALPATAASAQYWGGNDRVRHEWRECQRELRQARNRWEYERELNECRRDIARVRYQQYRRHDGYGYGDRYGDRYDRYRDRDDRW